MSQGYLAPTANPPLSSTAGTTPPITAYGGPMCRSIKTLRPPFVAEATDDEVRAAALQYVRKVSGFRAPSRANTAAFERAVEAVGAATRDLLDHLEVGRRAEQR
jgi:hypothetical protein